jgi:hypothetical protein
LQIIRTSDRGAFKRCRRSWDLGSKIRQNLVIKGPVPKPLDFGTAIHRGMESWYNPMQWEWDRELRKSLSVAAFLECQREQKARYLAEMPDMDEELRKDFNERTELGTGMLYHYFHWSANMDQFTPKMVEIEFEVPIPGLEGTYAEGAVYQGRVDALMEDLKGRYWIWDHKTTARMDPTAHLELDEQCGSYAWALQLMLGIPIEGVVYNELYKGVPGPPTVLKNGNFSKSKSQDTSYELYFQALMERFEYIPDEYADILETFRLKGNEYFRRTQVHRSPEELRTQGERIRLEALDMLDPNIRIYPNPTKFNCQNCMFRTPCIAMNDGSDVKWILAENYKVRTDDNDRPPVSPE